MPPQEREGMRISQLSKESLKRGNKKYFNVPRTYPIKLVCPCNQNIAVIGSSEKAFFDQTIPHLMGRPKRKVTSMLA